MKKGKPIRGAVLVLLAVSCLGQRALLRAQVPGARPPTLAADTANLFLTDDDVAHVKRVLPGLADASQLGPQATARYLAKLDISSERITQTVTHMSVAYSAIKFEEWMAELRPMLDAKPSTYRQLLEQSQHRLDSLTAKYKTARVGGKTALEVNEEIVRRNLTDVEALLGHVQRLRPSSMPSHQ